MTSNESPLPFPSSSCSFSATATTNTTGWTLWKQGAEARLWWIPSLWQGCGAPKMLCKERFPKRYRFASLDTTLRRGRTKAEVRAMVKCRRAGVACPAIYGVSLELIVPEAAEASASASNKSSAPSCAIFLEYLEGPTVKDYLRPFEENQQDDKKSDSTTASESAPQCKRSKRVPENNDNIDDDDGVSAETNGKGNNDDKVTMMAYEMGKLVAQLHNLHITHGDLTTSNMIWRKQQNDGKLYLLDFGLAQMAVTNPEEKAVDLYVLERALQSTHAVLAEVLLAEIWRAYKQHSNHADSVLHRLQQVRLRGRKREVFG